MFGKAAIDLGGLFLGERKLFSSLRIIKAFPKGHGQLGPVLGGKFQ